MRFRKTIKIAPGIKFNLSKSGISTTIGTKGFSINSGSKGTYLNTGIPGTGLYSRKRLSNNQNKYSESSNSSVKNVVFSEADLWTRKKSGYPINIILLISGIIFLFFQQIIAVLLLLSAIILMIRWIRTNAGKSSSEIRKARVAWDKMDSEKIIQHLEKAYLLYPNPILLDDIIFQAKINNHYEVALKYLDLADDNNIDTIFNKAECFYAIHDYKKAVLYFEKVTDIVETEPQKDNLFSKLGISLFYTNEYKRAIEMLQKLSNNYENESLKNLLIGKSLFNINEIESAIFTLTNFMSHKRKYDENMFEMCYTLGQIYIKLGENVKAKHWLNKIYTQDINYKDTYELLQTI